LDEKNPSAHSESTMIPDEDSDVEDNDAWTDNVVNPSDMDSRLQELVLCAGLCNNATIHHDTKADTWQANGDATEIALQVFAHKLAHGRPNLTRNKKTHDLQRVTTKNSVDHIKQSDEHFELVVEHPFDSTIKRMSTAWRVVSANGESDECLVFLKGAIERVLDRCAFVSMADELVPVTDELKEDIIAKVDEVGVRERRDMVAPTDMQTLQLAAEGLRVLGLSGKKVRKTADQVKATPRNDLEDIMCFLGLAGI
jgi:P-type Na+/K+ transporter